MVKWIRILPLLLVFGLMIATLPLAAAETSRVTSVIAGNDCSYAIRDDGTLWAWGGNEWGQLGIGSEANQPFPARVMLDRVKAVAAGWNFTLALRDDGTVWAWGDNTYGELGDGTNVTRTVPARVHRLSGVKAIAAGSYFAMALCEDGTVWAWGPGKSWNDVNYEPARIDIGGVAAISCGSSGQLCAALKEDGTVWTWGVGHAGSIACMPITNVTAISCSGDSILALKDDGTVWGWGSNAVFQLGAVTASRDQATPVRTDRLENVTLAATNGGTSFAVTRDGRTFVWGGGAGPGMQGIGERTSEVIEAPEPIGNLTGLKAISAGYRHCLALRDDGSVLAWGANDKGQIGNGLNDSMYRVEFMLPNGTIMDNADTSYYHCEPAPVQIVVGEVPAINNSTTFIPVVLASPLAVPDGTPQPANISLSAGNGWGVALGAPANYIAIGENDDIYVFSGNDIRCTGRDGKQKWSLAVPDQWIVCRNRERVNMFLPGGGEYVVGTGERPVYALSDGTLYLYVVPNTEYTVYPGWYDVYGDASANGGTWAIMAISPDGKIAWTKSLDMFPKKFDDTFVGASCDRVYVFQGYTETVMDSNGTVLFRIGNVATPAAVDERGNIYVADAIAIQCGAGWIDGDAYADFRFPGRNISAYGPDGRLLWQKDVGEYITWNYVHEDLRPEYGTTPIYRNGTLYIAVRNGAVALDTNGGVKWSQALERGLFRFFPAMPVDSHGNVYVENQYYNEPDATHDVYVISDDGRNISSPRRYEMNARDLGTVARDGIIYDIYWDTGDITNNVLCPANLSNLAAYTIRAYDIVNDTVLWAYTIPTENRKDIVLDSSNFYDIFGESMADWKLLNYAEQSQYVIDNTRPGNRTEFLITLYLDGNTLYAIAHEANYEIPVVFGKSQCVYASGLYVIDTKGDLAYGKPLNGVVTAATVSNGTVFLATGNGGLSAVTVGAVAGLALLGAIAIASKFFLFGSVARARSRLDKNENRNLVLAYIRANPGNTLNEISRGMRMNLGTVRYHLLILSMNHKIATFSDGKFVRYFPNSNFYSREEQQIIALLRRENTKQILQSLLDSPGLTNAELSERLYQPHSSINVYLKELVAKGVTIRENAADGRQVYSLESRYREMIVSLSQRLACDI